MSKKDDDEPIIGMWELLNAVETVVAASDPAKREALAETIDACADHFPMNSVGLLVQVRQRCFFICSRRSMPHAGRNPPASPGL